jgi:hypothetical protein
MPYLLPKNILFKLSFSFFSAALNPYSKSKQVKTVFRAWLFNTTVDPLMFPLSFILHNLMFSKPHDASLVGSMGLNLRLNML